MPHTFHHSIRDNGIYAFIPPVELKLLGAYDMHSDDFGNTWASSSPTTPRALNRATGASHTTIVKARKFLSDHGIIVPVAREVVKALYGERARRPPCNATVWHITCTIKRCSDENCRCHEDIPAGETPLYYLPERDTVDEADSSEVVGNADLSKNQTSIESGHEVSNSNSLPTKVDSKIAAPAKPRKRNEWFDNLAAICKLDPLTAGSYIAKVAVLVKGAGYTPDDILRFGELWYTREYPGGLRDKKSPSLTAVSKYIHWVREQAAPQLSPNAVDRSRPPDENYLGKD